jgi:hypothetical protein
MHRAGRAAVISKNRKQGGIADLGELSDGQTRLEPFPQISLAAAYV